MLLIGSIAAGVIVGVVIYQAAMRLFVDRPARAQKAPPGSVVSVSDET